MSINFTPTTGLWTEIYYFLEDDGSFYASTTSEPSIQCHNTGGHELLKFFKVKDPESVGSLTYDDMKEIFEDLKADALVWTNYLRGKQDTIEQLIYHCMYHRCGIWWA